MDAADLPDRVARSRAGLAVTVAHRALNGVDDFPVRIDMWLGHIAIESRMRSVGNRIIGEGRARHYDGEGKMTKDTGWQPAGCELYWDEPEPRRWWEFWK